MKRLLTLFIIHLFAVGLAQNYECASDDIHQSMMQNPEYAAKTLAFENRIHDNRDNSLHLRTLVGVNTIPVVVHVMQEGTSLTQISKDEIKERIKVLNQRMRKVAGSIGDGEGVDTQLQFALAVQDPDGNPTDGVLYVDVANYAYQNYGVKSGSNLGIDDLDLKNLSRWDTNQYYNIWLVSEIDNNNGGNGIAGYAYYPSAHGGLIDGAVIHVSAFKDNNSTTATHEIGHAFNVNHTFQGSDGNECPPSESDCSTEGDFVCDTPRHPRTLRCGDNNPCGDNLVATNYMSYAGSCRSMFTDGQKTRILTTIDPSFTYSRQSLLQSQGNLSLTPAAAPNADFNVPSEISCVGTTMQFTDNSTNVPNTFLHETSWNNISFNWNIIFEGETVMSSTEQNPEFTFNTAGEYSITLSVTNGMGTSTQTKTIIIVDPVIASSCIPSSYYPSANFSYTVNNVRFNTINNSTSNRANGIYGDYTCSSATVVEVEQTYDLNITVQSNDENTLYEVYIDYNNNGSLEYPSEMIANGQGVSEQNITRTHNITIPTNAIQNTLLRMRIITDAYAITDEKRNCTDVFIVGDTEDYGVFIQGSDIPSDLDGDGIPDFSDNCPSIANADQADLDNDGVGNVCDEDIDGDGVGNEADCDAYDVNITIGNIYYVDNDNDGYGDNNSSTTSCTQPIGYVTNNTDCDDSNVNINPGATEIPGNGIDEDCDGSDASLPDGDGDGVTDATDNCPSVANPNQEDMDNDGQGDACDNDIDGDGVINSDDCNPTDANISTENTYYADTDGDGFGDSSNTMMACTQPTGYVTNNTDCDDTDGNINPNATEIPGNGIDEDCDGSDASLPDGDGDGVADATDNCPSVSNPDQEDMDNDGQGDACDNDIDGDGIINADDCNPTDANISTENIYYEDADGDGFGDSSSTMMACTQPTGYVSNNTDCDDSNSNINPDATEIPGNGIDEDCDGVDGSTGNNDSDGDGIADSVDNCPNTANPNQEDGNGDGVGDHCEACDLPYMVELTRTGDTTATFDAGNSVWHYQGTANRAGRPLRPYPMYGMGDMTVVHTQYNLVPAFDYSVWLRTICGNDMYSDWAGPFYLPTYNGNLRNQKAISLTPNPAISIVKLSKVEARTIEIYDLNGTLVLHVDTEDNQFEVSSLQTGKYNLKIMDAEGNVHYEQLIKK